MRRMATPPYFIGASATPCQGTGFFGLPAGPSASGEPLGTAIGQPRPRTPDASGSTLQREAVIHRVRTAVQKVVRLYDTISSV